MGTHSLPVRALWFVFIGWWATPIVVNVAVFFFLTVVGVPVGVLLINNVPTVLALEPKREFDPEADDAPYRLNSVTANGVRR